MKIVIPIKPKAKFPVMTGGSWDFDAMDTRLDDRERNGPSMVYISQGFRIVRKK